MEEVLIIERNILNEECCSFLAKRGYNITKIDISKTPKYNATSFWNKYLNIFFRIFLNDKNYHYQAEKKFYKRHQSKLIKQFLKKNKKIYDKIIIIRPDYLDSKVIKQLAEASKEMVGYFWDSISYQDAMYVSQSSFLFKNLFSYDQLEVERYQFLNLKFITNFYYPIEETLEKTIPKKLYYLGNITTERRDIILEKIISKIFHKDEYSWNIMFNNFPKRDYNFLTNEYIKYIQEFKDYHYNLLELMSAHTVFDINPSYNSGLSFRFFEAMYYQTKIITTNKNVKEYDFYNSNNILIYNDDTTQEQINAFLKLPFVKMNDSVIEKYRVDNWIKKLFS